MESPLPSEHRQALSDGEPLSPSFTSIYTLDILTVLVKHLPWSVLAQVAFWPVPAPRTVGPEKRRRVFQSIRRFVPYTSDDTTLPEEFFSRLQQCEGAIIGSIPRLLLLSGTPYESELAEARDLNIATANGGLDPLFDFFEQLGFSGRSALPAPQHQRSAMYLERMTKSTDNETLVVLITTSKTKALSVVLDSPYTGHMNAITAHSVVSFYPRLTYANESLIFEDRSSINPLPYSFTVTDSNSHWTKPCGYYCPMVPRITYGDPGCASYDWSPSPVVESSSMAWETPRPFARLGSWGSSDGGRVKGWGAGKCPVRPTDVRLQELLKWRISARCKNPHCPNALLQRRREQYLGRYL